MSSAKYTCDINTAEKIQNSIAPHLLHKFWLGNQQLMSKSNIGKESTYLTKSRLK